MKDIMEGISPLPWQVYAPHKSFNSGIKAANGRHIGIMAMTAEEPGAVVSGDEEAAYIVHAANLYPELVEELDNALIAIGMGWDLAGIENRLAVLLNKCKAGSE